MRAGERVSGNYLGLFPFEAGTIVSSRLIEFPQPIMEFIVELDEPIVVFSRSKTRLAMLTNFDGSKKVSDELFPLERV